MAYIRVIDLSNRNEADVICSILRESNINYSLHCLEDTAFDGLFTGHLIWGYIEVDEEQKELAIQLHQEYLKSKIQKGASQEETESSNQYVIPRNWIVLSLTAIFLIAAVVFLILFLNSNDNLKRINKSMSVSYYWDRTARVLTVTSKRTGKVVEKDYDLKRDGKYSKRISYAENGQTYYEYYDSDENGVYEEARKYTTNGTLLLSDVISNADGTMETQTFYYPNGAMIKYVLDDGSNLILHGYYTSPTGEKRLMDLPNGTIK